MRAVADTMISIPHPYPGGEAERYVAAQAAALAEGRAVAFAIVERAAARLCGVAEVRDIDREHGQAELSFWLTPAVWGRGYMTECVGALVRYGFDDLGLNRLYAHHMVRNPASGRVLAANGFRQEGVLRQRVRKWGRYEDVVLWAVLAGDDRPPRADAGRGG